AVRVDEEDALAYGEGEVGDARRKRAAEDGPVVQERDDAFADLGEERFALTRCAAAAQGLARAQQERGNGKRDDVADERGRSADKRDHAARDARAGQLGCRARQLEAPG